MLSAKEMISEAIDYCTLMSKGKKTRQEVVDELKTTDNYIHSHFRYSIARDIARYIQFYHGNLIRNIRLYGSTMEYTAGKYSDIDMIVQVQDSGENFSEDISELGRMLAEEYYGLIGEYADQYTYLTDIHVLNDAKKSEQSSSAYLEHILAYDSVAI